MTKKFSLYAVSSVMTDKSKTNSVNEIKCKSWINLKNRNEVANHVNVYVYNKQKIFLLSNVPSILQKDLNVVSSNFIKQIFNVVKKLLILN